VGNQKAKKQRISGNADKVKIVETVNKRGIDWAKIFQDNPSLSPPGYEETIEILKKRNN